MARKSDSGIGVAIVVVTLVVVFLGGLIVIATVSSTVLIAAYWVYAYVRARALPQAPGSSAVTQRRPSMKLLYPDNTSLVSTAWRWRDASDQAAAIGQGRVARFAGAV